MLRRANRLRNRKDVTRVYRTGRTVRMPLGSVKLAQNQLGTIRLAVVVSKKVAKSAPKRNRIRRRIYEIVRRDLPSLKPGYDIMVSVFDENVFTMPAPELERQFADLWQKTSLRQ